MTALDVLLRLRAIDDGKRRERTSRLHRHIDEKPLVVVAYRLAGELAAAGPHVWDDRGKAPSPGRRRAPEPRDPISRRIQPVLGQPLPLLPEPGRVSPRGRYAICKHGPQLIVPTTRLRSSWDPCSADRSGISGSTATTQCLPPPSSREHT